MYQCGYEAVRTPGCVYGWIDRWVYTHGCTCTDGIAPATTFPSAAAGSRARPVDQSEGEEYAGKTQAGILLNRCYIHGDGTMRRNK